MSQITAFVLGGGGGGGVLTLTGNSGGAVSPTAGNINVVGDGTTITVAGNPGTSTLTISSLVSAGITSITGDIGGAQSGPAITLTGGSSGGVFTGAANTFTMSFAELNLPDTSSSSSGLININGVPFLHKFGAATNAFGGGAGNFSMSGPIATTAFGEQALAGLTTGGTNASYCTAVGYHCLNAVSSGYYNSFLGAQSGQSITTGVNNSGIGVNSGISLVSGTDNCFFGVNCGNAYTGAESSNIIIGSQNPGVIGESFTLRIGNGTGAASAGQLDKAFISGIFGITVGVSGVPVVVDNANQLGTVASSRRYKDNIEDMDDYSDEIMDLRCVRFNYKNHSSKDISVGLIAEEVEDVMPNLVVKDFQGRPETVRYLDLIPMLLNEVQKLKKIIDDLESRLEDLE